MKEEKWSWPTYDGHARVVVAQVEAGARALDKELNDGHAVLAVQVLDHFAGHERTETVKPENVGVDVDRSPEREVDGTGFLLLGVHLELPRSLNVFQIITELGAAHLRVRFYGIWRRESVSCGHFSQQSTVVKVVALLVVKHFLVFFHVVVDELLRSDMGQPVKFDQGQLAGQENGIAANIEQIGL